MKSFLSFSFTILFLAFLFYFVPLTEVLRALKETSVEEFIFAFLFYGFSQLFRSVRWKLLIKNISLLQSFAMNSANIMFNNLLPARTGELSWFYYTKSLRINISYALWSFFVGRFYDLMALFLLLFFSLSVTYPLFLIPNALLLIIGLSLYKVHILLPASGKLGDIREFLEREASFKLSLSLYSLSLLSSLSKFFSLLTLLNLWDAFSYRVFLAFLGGELSSVLPVHGFMGFGTYEFAFSLPLKLIGESLKEWLTLGFVFHSFLLISSLILGIPSALYLTKRFS
ncbi:MAG: lysylphosphatidylglycerol synthase domain-containing protein [Aquificaceae bacterium]|nr:lysylphosphatidylglycerol synthase domain-containing protein [Aquificaceae bacterium]